MENKLTETLTSLISEITQMERNNAKLNEDIRELEKEKEKGYKSFNTETHILVERRALNEAIDYVDELSSTASYTRDNIESAESNINEARYNSDDIVDGARDVRRDLEKLLVEEEEPTFKKPAVKLTVNKGDNNA